MSQKTTVFIIGIFLAIIGGFFLAAFLISREKEKPFVEALRDVSPFGEILPDRGIKLPLEGGEPPGGGGGAGGVSATSTPLPALWKISAEPVVSATTFFRDGTEYVRYILLDTGNVYEYGATTTVKTRVTNTTAPGLKEVFWGVGGESLIARYLNESNALKTYRVQVLAPDEGGTAVPGESSGRLVGIFLADDIDEIAVSPDKTQYFSLVSKEATAVGTLTGFGTAVTSPPLAFTLPLTEWLPSWPEKNTLVFTTKSSARAEGFAYAFDVRQKTLKKILGGISGLTVLPSPGGEKMLYSRGLSGTIDTFVFDIKTGASQKIPVTTLSEKCAWETSATLVYCAVPERLGAGEYPDDWYQGVATFSDALWSIDTKTNTPQRIAVPVRDAQEEIDATSLILSSDESVLFFINKKDFSLWGLRLGS